MATATTTRKRAPRASTPKSKPPAGDGASAPEVEVAETLPVVREQASVPAVMADTLTIEALTGQVNLIQQAMRAVMKEGEHYGVIPGTNGKPSLLKPGAEKLSLLFRLAPEYDIEQTDLPGGHREYRIVCTLIHIPSGQVFGAGVGLCSTMESQYRWRGGARRCPSCDAPAIKKSKYPPRNNKQAPPGWYCFAKVGGCGLEFDHDDARITSQSEERQENPDIADTYNTVLKVGKKRSHVDACLTATAASDIFTQDVEDMDLGPRQPTGDRDREAERAAAEPARPAAQERAVEVVNEATGEVVERPAGQSTMDFPGKELYEGPAPGEIEERKRAMDGLRVAIGESNLNKYGREALARSHGVEKLEDVSAEDMRADAKILRSTPEAAEHLNAVGYQAAALDAINNAPTLAEAKEAATKAIEALPRYVVDAHRAAARNAIESASAEAEAYDAEARDRAPAD